MGHEMASVEYTVPPRSNLKFILSLRAALPGVLGVPKQSDGKGWSCRSFHVAGEATISCDIGNKWKTPTNHGLAGPVALWVQVFFIFSRTPGKLSPAASAWCRTHIGASCVDSRTSISSAIPLSSIRTFCGFDPERSQVFSGSMPNFQAKA